MSIFILELQSIKCQVTLNSDHQILHSSHLSPSRQLCWMRGIKRTEQWGSCNYNRRWSKDLATNHINTVGVGRLNVLVKNVCSRNVFCVRCAEQNQYFLPWMCSMPDFSFCRRLFKMLVIVLQIWKLHRLIQWFCFVVMVAFIVQFVEWENERSCNTYFAGTRSSSFMKTELCGADAASSATVKLQKTSIIKRTLISIFKRVLF